MALSSIILSNQPDEIWWRWTPNGQYSAASAYECQFKGAMVYFLATEVWKARTEPKCKFFVWLVLHNKILTADNMAKKNWNCNPTCALCYCMLETADHLMTKCNYSEALWQTLAPKHSLPSYNCLSPLGGPVDWVLHLCSSGVVSDKREMLGLLFFIWWNLWKERNRRIFENEKKSVPQLVALIREEISWYNRAMSFGVV
jgi:hypothetical protein